MVDWGSPEVIGICLEVSVKLNLYFTGIFTWHFIGTFRDVEWQLLRRRLKWRWPYLYYLGARYFLLGFQLPLHEVLKPVSYEILAITGCAISVFASGNLLFRVIAIWRENRFMVAFLILIAVGHWVMLFAIEIPPTIISHGNFIPNPDDHTDADKVARNVDVPFFLYTFILDLVIVILTISGLLRQRAARSTKLWKNLYRQGIIYFVVTFIVQVPTVALAWATESACMLGALGSPGLAISVMASSHAVTSLLALPRVPEEGRPAVHEKLDINVAAYRSERLSTNINLPVDTDTSEVQSSTEGLRFTEIRTRREHDLEAAAGGSSSPTWQANVVSYAEKDEV